MKNKLKINFKDKKTIIISILLGLILISLIIFICVKVFHKDKELTPDDPTTKEFENYFKDAKHICSSHIINYIGVFINHSTKGIKNFFVIRNIPIIIYSPIKIIYGRYIIGTTNKIFYCFLIKWFYSIF